MYVLSGTSCTHSVPSHECKQNTSILHCLCNSTVANLAIHFCRRDIILSQDFMYNFEYYSFLKVLLSYIVHLLM